jgi:hypothetical protein
MGEVGVPVGLLGMCCQRFGIGFGDDAYRSPSSMVHGEKSADVHSKGEVAAWERSVLPSLAAHQRAWELLLWTWMDLAPALLALLCPSAFRAAQWRRRCGPLCNFHISQGPL